MGNLKRAVDGLIFATVALGFVLLYVASGVVPGWLLASLFAGEFAYAGASLAVAKKYRWSYYLIIVLAVLVLAVSLPQPEHYAFAATGQYLPLAIFALGSVFQVCLLVLVPVYLWRTRSRPTPPPAGPSPSQ
ncbi:MAG: hypothetical protein JRN09_03850 [Nitrososphaerota archaeon]|jgi:hypothetical protein|nr:hypothetical protein [Nitrososphaerota archaeon]